ncbi:MAG: biotin/acetyl-CoA-carboxylase ligase [Pseudonocardia sp.]|nr:biotin/acetyl-CoA-carboxylase ligase [Pseudonocardia sp.]
MRRVSVLRQLDRRPLDVAALRAGLIAPQGPLTELRVVAQTGSTNADLLAAAAAGAPDRTALVAEHQQSGRGRLGREWDSPLHAGLTVSLLLRPAGVPVERLGWLPLLAGLSVRRVISDLALLPAALKWPNDVLLGDSELKCAGILTELAGSRPSAVVIGIGLNVTTAADELPPGATSLLAQGAACTNRDELLVELLRGLCADEAAWRAAAGDATAFGLRDEYRAGCATLGSTVRLELPGEEAVQATAEDVDEVGRLVVRTVAGIQRTVAAGDVVHLRHFH